MDIKAKCSSCKHFKNGSFLLSSFCSIKKKNIYFVNKICREWKPSVKDMDVWIERSGCEIQ